MGRVMTSPIMIWFWSRATPLKSALAPTKRELPSDSFVVPLSTLPASKNCKSLDTFASNSFPQSSFPDDTDVSVLVMQVDARRAGRLAGGGFLVMGKVRVDVAVTCVRLHGGFQAGGQP